MTETLTYRQLRRSRSDRMVAGVSGGLGRYFDVNPVLYRVGFVVLALLGGAGILIYAVAALVIPDEGHDESIVEAAVRERRDRPWRLVGLALVTISTIVLLSEARVWDGHLAWVLVLISGIVLLSFGPRLWREATATPGPDTSDSRAAPSSAPQRSFAIATAVLGVLVVAAGVLGVLAAAGVDVPWAFALAVAAGAVGVAVVVGAVLHLRVGWLVFVGLVLGAAAILASTIDLKLEDGMGDRTYAPLSAGRPPRRVPARRRQPRARPRPREAAARRDRGEGDPGRRPSGRDRPARASRSTSRATSTGARASCSASARTGTTSTTPSRALPVPTSRSSSSTRTSASARSRWSAPYDDRDVPPTPPAEPGQARDRRRLRRHRRGDRRRPDAGAARLRAARTRRRRRDRAVPGAVALHARPPLARRAAAARRGLDRAPRPRDLGPCDPRARADRGRARPALAPRRLACGPASRSRWPASSPSPPEPRCCSRAAAPRSASSRPAPCSERCC